MIASACAFMKGTKRGNGVGVALFGGFIYLAGKSEKVGNVIDLIDAVLQRLILISIRGLFGVMAYVEMPELFGVIAIVLAIVVPVLLALGVEEIALPGDAIYLIIVLIGTSQELGFWQGLLAVGALIVVQYGRELLPF